MTRLVYYGILANSIKLFRLSPVYLILTVIIFTVEILIAVYVHDGIVRPYVGDILVVILIYCFFRSFFEIGVIKLALSVLAFAFAIEALQYYDILKIFNLQHSKFWRIVIGTSFAWMDILMYVIGIVIVLLIESYNNNTSLRET